MKLQLSDRAKTHLLEIETYTLETFGPRQWIIYSAQLEQGFATLRAFPAIGLRPPELSGGVHVFRVRQHWLCYEIMGDTLSILAIVERIEDFKSSE